MTYSIVAHDETTGEFGVAVASRFFAVGALVPHIRAGKGAVATQAFVSPIWGIDAADRLAAGEAPQDVLAALTQADEGRANRQLHMVDAQGRTAAFTGESCVGWCGHVTARGVSVAGNMLTGEAVIADTLAAYRDHPGLPLAERLMTAMEAGERAGGDKRGKQSAALVIHRSEPYPWLDIRADDHADPLTELRRLYDVAHERFLFMADILPTRTNPHGLTDRSGVDAAIAEAEQRRRDEGRESRSFATPL
ncbi:Uncharacterized conserved protein, Ntn-hydrolase superfamily [Lutimaribacter pacificus]|uniref:Uncharacterized conserved protein, Ntn-hydrolase superfamily n=1 Tax=Lutimaribacter pacificus TaxID=391948 RepID=A0A1H0HP45_9RHOB|nr:DUF1028 domain-containing protein [Lutimaribacter pacificus]SDO20952.1 Uncharacterized conserved protein, Ntn-hydrolase superfamily [Lutimaribacter pacificus]SHK33147.1 Uncharacterized conserved protein, Ntn-hydrolase superfamily [Lutimaribacter pacificus]